MIHTVFISDLHLHPDHPDIEQRFRTFALWAQQHAVKNIYILGDFFSAWPGDDSLDEWSRGIAKQIKTLSDAGVAIFYMAGNRDFLLGAVFAQLAGWQVLSEPTCVTLGDERVLLVHGDRYCTKDKAHQRFRWFTRNRVFPRLFLLLPLTYRQRIVQGIRKVSTQSKQKTAEEMDVVPQAVIQHMMQYQVNRLIHGHTHRPGLSVYPVASKHLERYVLSDWDDIPSVLCYDSTMGFKFERIVSVGE